MSKKSDNTVVTYLHDMDEQHYPPTMPMLRIGCNGRNLFLNICKGSEEPGKYVYTTLHELGFDTETFLRALAAAISNGDNTFDYHYQCNDEYLNSAREYISGLFDKIKDETEKVS